MSINSIITWLRTSRYFRFSAFAVILTIVFQNCSDFTGIDRGDSGLGSGTFGGLSFDSPEGKLAKSFLQNNCASCHANGARLGNIGDFFKIDRLVASGLLVVGHPEKSRIYMAVIEGKMPRNYANLVGDPEVLRKWIENKPKDPNVGPGPLCSTDELNGAEPLSQRIWRLTGRQIDYAFKDLFQMTTHFHETLPASSAYNGYQNNATYLTIRNEFMERYVGKLESITTNYLLDKTKISGLWPCDTVSYGNRSCVQKFIAKVGRQLYRRPITEKEQTQLMEVYEVARSRSAKDGVSLVIQSLLASPYFLYRRELGQGSGETHLLKGYEKASFLSFTFWQSLPDDQLLDAAKSGKLDNSEGVQAQITRLLADPKGQRFMNEFFEDWLDIEDLPFFDDKAELYSKWSQELGEKMVQEIQSLGNYLVWDVGGTVNTLMTTDKVFVDKELAGIYGISSNSTTLKRKTIKDPNRIGILTRLAFLTQNSRPLAPYPISRGRSVRSKLLCRAMPSQADLGGDPPPPFVPDPRFTTRQRLAKHTDSKQCMGCHEFTDPIGWGLGQFDPIGAFRTHENEQPVDVSGYIEFTEHTNGSYVGSAELSRKLATSEDVQNCMTKQLYRYIYGAGDNVKSSCEIKKLQQSHRQENLSLKQVIFRLVNGSFGNIRSQGE